MTIRELLNKTDKQLKTKSTSSSLDAEVLFSHVLGKSKEYLITHHKTHITKQKTEKFLELIQKRAAGWPVAYLTHHKEFFGLDFYVDQNVLIPRPETEGLVELAATYIRTYIRAYIRRPIKILDLGTGSGCIVISLAKILCPLHPAPCPLFYASDISKSALKVAKKNARQYRAKITFKQSNLLSGWKNQSFDMIIANLPYLPKRSDPSTRVEPTRALVAKKQGLALYEKLFKQIRSHSQIRPFADSIFLEIGHDQGSTIKKLAAKWLPTFETKIYKDLSGRNRYAVLQSRLTIL